MLQAVIFDFDGVIVNTYNLCFDIRKSMEPTLNHEVYKNYLEGNLLQLYANSDGKTINDIRSTFYTPYQARLHAEKHHSEEISSLIRKLYSTKTLHIVTSAPEATVERYLRENNLLDCFTSILGLETAFSKVDKFKMIFKEFGITVHDTVFITDTLGDIREANEVKLPTIGVAWGFHDTHRLERGNPYKIVHSVSELDTTLTELL